MLTQYIYEDLDFRSPLLVTFFANALLVIYLPLWQIWIYLGLVKDPSRKPCKKIFEEREPLIEDMNPLNNLVASDEASTPRSDDDLRPDEDLLPDNNSIQLSHMVILSGYSDC